MTKSTQPFSSGKRPSEVNSITPIKGRGSPAFASSNPYEEDFGVGLSPSNEKNRVSDTPPYHENAEVGRDDNMFSNLERNSDSGSYYSQDASPSFSGYSQSSRSTRNKDVSPHNP